MVELFFSSLAVAFVVRLLWDGPPPVVLKIKSFIDSVFSGSAIDEASNDDGTNTVE